MLPRLQAFLESGRNAGYSRRQSGGIASSARTGAARSTALNTATAGVYDEIFASAHGVLLSARYGSRKCPYGQCAKPRDAVGLGPECDLACIRKSPVGHCEQRLIVEADGELVAGCFQAQRV